MDMTQLQHATSSQRLSWRVFVMSLLYTSAVNCYNLDVQRALVLTSAPNTSFGYSVTQWQPPQTNGFAQRWVSYYLTLSYVKYDTSVKYILENYLFRYLFIYFLV